MLVILTNRPKNCTARNIQEDDRCAPPTQPPDCYHYLPNQADRGDRSPSNGEARKERIRGIHVGGSTQMQGGQGGGKREGGFDAG